MTYTLSSCARVQHANNNYAVLHISHVVLPGCSLYDSVVTLVIVRNGSPCNHESRRGNFFTSNLHTLHVDADEPLGCLPRACGHIHKSFGLGTESVYHKW